MGEEVKGCLFNVRQSLAVSGQLVTSKPRGIKLKTPLSLFNALDGHLVHFLGFYGHLDPSWIYVKRRKLEYFGDMLRGPK